MYPTDLQFILFSAQMEKMNNTWRATASNNAALILDYGPVAVYQSDFLDTYIAVQSASIGGVHCFQDTEYCLFPVRASTKYVRLLMYFANFLKSANMKLC